MSVTIASKILDHVKQQEPALINITRALVEAESPSDRPETHVEVRRVIQRALADVGYVARETGVPGGPRHVFAVPANRPKGQASQLLLGHYDTVWPVGTLSERPFTVDGNVIHGPGAFEMKAGLAQMILALGVVRDLDLHTPVVPIVFVNADEEIGSRTSMRYVRWLAEHANRAYVMEPALGQRGDIKTERKGVGRFEITVYSTAGDAEPNPAAGASTIFELSNVVQQLFALNDVEQGVTVNVGTIDGGIQPDATLPRSSAIVDVRVPTVEIGDEIERSIYALKATTPNTGLEIEGGIRRPAMQPTPRNRRLWEIAKHAGDQLGLELHAARAIGDSDGNTVSQYTATLDGLGAVGDGAHAAHEHVLVDRTLERTALLTMLLLEPPLER